GDGRAIGPTQPWLEVDLVARPAEVEIAAAYDVLDHETVDPASGREHQAVDPGQQVRSPETARGGVGVSSQHDGPLGELPPLGPVGVLSQAHPVVTRAVQRKGAAQLIAPLRAEQQPPSAAAELRVLVQWNLARRRASGDVVGTGWRSETEVHGASELRSLGRIDEPVFRLKDDVAQTAGSVFVELMV